MDKIKHQTLKNGARVIFINRPELNSISATLSFDVGVEDEPQALNGISHFIEHLTCKNNQIVNNLDLIGAAVDGMTTEEFTNYFLKAKSNDFLFAFRIVTKTLKTIKIKPKEIEPEKKIIQEEIAMRKNDRLFFADDLLNKILYPNLPIGRSLLGTNQSIKNITPQSIRAYYNKKFVANNLAACFIGKLSNTTQRAILNEIKKFPSRHESQKSTNLLQTKIKNHKSRLTIQQNNDNQIVMAMGFPGVRIKDNKKYILYLLSIILTDGYNSRLFKKIREKDGLAYYLESFNTEYSSAGHLTIKLSCRKSNYNKILTILKQEFKKITSQAVKDSELVRAKKILKNSLTYKFENPEELSQYLTEELIATGKNRDLKELNGVIDPITTKNILEIATETISSEKLHAVVVGKPPINKKLILKRII